MGAVGSSGRWEALPPTSLLGLVLERRVLLDRWHPTQVDPRCRRQCTHYDDKDGATAIAEAKTERQVVSLGLVCGS